MPRGDVPVTVRRRVRVNSAITYPDSTDTWAEVTDGGTFQESADPSIYTVQQLEFLVPWLAWLAALSDPSAAGAVGNVRVLYGGFEWKAVSYVEEGRRRHHRITAARRVGFEFIGS